MLVGSAAGAYRSPSFASATADECDLVWLPRSGGSLVSRPLPGGATGTDLRGPYPLFDCAEWGALAEDLAVLDRDHVSAVVVTDPLTCPAEVELRRAFPALVRPFKRHLLVDTTRPLAPLPTGHRRNLRRGRAAVEIDLTMQPDGGWQRDWPRLYVELVDRHEIRGPAAFDARSLRAQLEVPGALLARATCAEETVALQVWYRDGDRAYYHLGATSEVGYAVGASFVLFDAVIDHLTDAVRWIDLGAGAGLHDAAGDGLVRFKRGWANDERLAFLCGRIGQPARYRTLTGDGTVETSFFPAYRAPDVGLRV